MKVRGRTKSKDHPSGTQAPNKTPIIVPNSQDIHIANAAPRKYHRLSGSFVSPSSKRVIPTGTTATLPTRASPPWSGRGAGWRTTGRWSLPPHKRAPGGPDRREHAVGLQENASSSRG